MKSMFLRLRSVLSLFVFCAFASIFALAFGYKVVASRLKPTAPRAAAPVAKAPQARTSVPSKSQPEDDPAVQEFFRFKRLPAGETLLSEERYAPARQQTRALSQTATETKNRRLWQQLGSAENATNPLASAKFYTGAIAANGNFFIGGTANQGVLRGSINEGNAAWEQLQPSLGSAVAVDQHDAKVIFLSRPGALYCSTDAGHSFTNISSGLQDSGLFVTPFVVDALTSQRIWLGGTAVWRTQDGGTTWQQASPTFADKSQVSALSYAPANHNFVLAGTTTGTIYRSYNGLASTADQEWQSAMPRTGYVSALVVEPQNPNVVYATYATFGGAHVWRSDDAGATWQSLAGEGASALPDVPVHALVIDPRNSQRLFIGTDLGLFTTTDGGKTWASEATEMGGAIVESLALQTTNDEVKLFAFTYGNGVWESDLTLALECTYSISASSQPSATGGQFSVFVSTASECGWTATSNANWITITSANAGKGSASISYTVPPHYELAARTGTLTVGGQTVSITQTGLATGCEVNSIKVGETIAGMIKAGPCIPMGYGSTTSYNATYFTFTANRGDQVALSFQGEFEPQLRMWAPNGTSNTYTSSSRTLRAPSTGFLTIASSGTHLIEVSNYFSSRGNFTLSLVAPTAPPTCGAFSLSTNAQTFEANGGGATVEVSGGATCPWTVKSNATWITAPTTAGTGESLVNLTVAANTTTTVRTGSIEIAGQTVTITQAGTNGSCTPTPVNIGQTINGVLSTGDCNSRYNFDGYPARSADLYTFTATEGQQVMIAATATTTTLVLQLNLTDQNGAPLTAYGFRSPLGTGYVTIPATGTYTLEVTTTYFNSSSRTGNYSLSLLSPASGCGYVLPATTGIKGYEAEGGVGIVSVTSGNGCGWVATTHYDWIKINTPTGLSGESVEFTLTPNNTGRSRIGAILISGQSFLLEQAATGGTCLSSPITPGQSVKGSLDVTDCLSTYDVDAYATDRYSFNATVGQQLRVDVNPTTTAGVRVYLLDSNNRLLQRSTGSFPTGNGFFTIPVTGRYNLEIATTAFSGSVPYTATMSLVAAGCSYTATAVANYFEAPGGEGSIDLTAGNDCLWDVSTASSWLTLAASSGSGTGHVNFTVAPNTSTTSRSGVINIGGQVLTINQAGTGGTCVEQPLIAGQTVNGRLTNSDCRSRGGASPFADRYLFSGLEGQQLSLSLRSGFSTASMILTDATGKTLDSSSRRIPLTNGYFRLPTTGSYFVEVVASTQQDYTLNLALVPSGCSIAIAPDIATVEPTGGSSNFKIIAGQNCPWNIADLPTWVTLSSSAGGSGSSTVNFTAAPNTTTARRRATLLIGGQSFVIEQPGVGGTCGTLPLTAGQAVKGTLGGADCLSNLLETNPTIKDRYTFTGLAGHQIALTAAADTAFPTITITVLDPTGAVYVRNSQRVPNLGFVTLPTDDTYTVEVTSSSASSTTNVNYSLTLEAVAPQCNFTITPANNLFEAAGGTGSLAVQVPDNAGGCSWNVTALPSWITIGEGANGTGSGTVNFKVAENTATSAREVTLIVAGNPVRIEQAGKSGSCSATPLAVGQTVNGTNSSADCRSRFRTSTSSGSYYARQLAFAFTAGQQLALTATNTSGFSFTPYLYIYDDKGVIVAQAETRLPAGTGFLSLPATGTYFVELTSRDSSFGTSYTWSLNLSTPTACAVSLLPQTTSFETSGGITSVGIVAGADCQWSAQSSADWLRISEGGSGTGKGQIKVTVANNPLGTSRRGTLTIGGQAVTIEQVGVGGTGALVPLTFGQPIAGNLLPADSVTITSFDTYYVDRYFFDAAAGQQLQLSYATPTASSFSDYRIRVLSPTGSELFSTTGTPASTLLRLPLSGRYIVEAMARFTTDYQLNAELVSATCNLVARPADQLFESGGGTGNFELIGPPDCTWLISRIPDWLTFTSMRAKGITKVEFTLLPNLTNSLRIADLSVGGQTVRIQQLGFGGTCAVRSITPGQTVRGTFGSQDCRRNSFGSYYQRFRFNATAGDQLAAVLSGGNRTSLLNAAGEVLTTATTTRLPEGTGYFTIPLTGTYFIDVETGTTASYMLSLVAATPGCNYVLSANGQSVDVQGGYGTVNVLSLGGCAWTTSNDASWVTINPSTLSGTGEGAVGFTVAANPSVSVRRATLTIAGQVFVVEQAGVGGLCLPLPLAPNQAVAGSLTGADCQARKLYTFEAAAGQQVLLTLNNSNNNSLSFSLLAPDGSTVGRGDSSTVSFIPSNGGFVMLPTSGIYTVVVSGSSFGRSDYQLSLQLVERGCNFEVANLAQPFTAAGGSGTIDVSSNSGCGWVALSLSSSVQIIAGNSGSGNGKIEYTVAANTGNSSRTATIVVAGKRLSIEQAGVGATCQTTPLKPGQFLSSTLGSNDCRSRVLSSGYPAKWYSFTGNAGEQLLVRFTASFTPTLSLLTASGTVLRTVRTETLPSNSGFFTLPASGAYVLEVSSDNFSTGNYSISFVTAAAGCGFNLSIMQQKFEASGGAGNFTVTANGTCQWYAYSDANWTTVSGGGTGTGNAAVNYTVAANTTGLSRLGRIYVNDQIYLVEQAGTGGSCQITPLTMGETITGMVTEADCRTLIKPISSSSYVQRADLYSFTGKARDRIVITAAAQGTTFTPQLSLFSANGQLLRQGERVPVGTGSYTLPANGTYWLEISTTGGYTMKVEQR